MPYEILAQQGSNNATKYILLPVSLLSLSYLVYLISWETRIALYGMLMLTILVGAILPDRYKPSLTVKNALALITVSTLAVLAYSWAVGAVGGHGLDHINDRDDLSFGQHFIPL